MRFFMVFSIFMAFPILIYAQTPQDEGGITGDAIATIAKVEGTARVLKQGEIRKHKLKQGDEVFAGDILTTGRRAKVRLNLFDQSIITLGELAKVSLKSRNEVAQSEGKAYFNIKPRQDHHQLTVLTDFVLIGVKGTEFLVVATEASNAVTLKEGQLSMATVGEQFELYRLNVAKEWSDYQKNTQDEFDDFKRRMQPNQSKAEHVDDFELEAGRSVSFDGHRTIEHLFNDALEGEMKEFEMF